MKKHLITNLQKHFTKKRTIIGGIILIIIILIVSLTGGSEEVVTTVEQGVFQKETRVAGRVVAKEEALLGFTKSGRISGLTVKVGDTVEKGQALVRLEQDSAQASVLLAQSNLAYEDARLSELSRGSRAEELRIQESKLNEAEVSTQLAKENLYQEVLNSYIVADDAIRFKVDQVFDTQDGFGKILPLAKNYSLETQINDRRREIRYTLKEWQEFTDTLSVDTVTTADVAQTKKYLEETRFFIDLVTRAVSEFSPSSSASQSTIDGYKASVSNGRLLVQAQINDLASKEEAYLVATQQVKQSSNELSLLRAGASSEEIAAQRARVLGEQARLADAQTLLSDGVIRAPFSGTIVQINAEEGEPIGANEPVLAIISEAGVEIESYIPEVFVGSITVGDTASIVFDAYSTRRFNGVVEEVEPKETLRDGISTYRTALTFDSEQANILLGMTANVTILAEERPDTLMIPLEAVQYDGKQAYVMVRNGEEDVRTNIETGDVDAQGRQEILSGLSVGNTIVYVKKD